MNQYSLNFYAFRNNKKIFCIVMLCLLLKPSFLYGGDEYSKYYHKAYEMMMNKQENQAEVFLATALKKRPKDSSLYFLRAHLRGDRLKKHAEAIHDYTKVIKLGTKNCDQCRKSNCYRGLQFYRIGMYQRAIKDYTISLRVMPVYKKVYLYRAKAYAKIGMVDKAIRDCKLYMKYFPNSKRLAINVLNKIQQGRTDFKD